MTLPMSSSPIINRRSFSTVFFNKKKKKKRVDSNFFNEHHGVYSPYPKISRFTPYTCILTNSFHATSTSIVGPFGSTKSDGVEQPKSVNSRLPHAIPAASSLLDLLLKYKKSCESIHAIEFIISLIICFKDKFY